MDMMSSGLAGCFTFCFTSRSSLLLPGIGLFGFALGAFCLCLCFVFCFWGALDDFFLTSSSRDMTATVLSKALEKKKVNLWLRSSLSVAPVALLTGAGLA